ncbi:hypothetical protein [Snuella lapsa]|uniref:Uncharacterized protein n=1 Tax=Snuella lapsa TaxID=870481 RepID=A0ABP6XDW6_9FLAO
MQKTVHILIATIILFSCSQNEATDNINEPQTLGEKILSIQLPAHFTRASEKFHIILSDTIGNLIDHKSYSNREETLSFYSTEHFSDSTPFILTFITDYSNSIFEVTVYSNLTNHSLNKNILLKPRSFSNKTPTINIKTQQLKDGFILNAIGHGYSMVKINDLLSGHYTSNFNNNLGSENIFIKYYNPTNITNNNYEWALMNNISSINGLDEINFSTNNVKTKQLTLDVRTELPLLTIHGYENEQLYNNISGHQIYDSQVPVYGFGGNHYYAYADIFENTTYSLSVTNYSLFGAGIPPSEILVPKHEISCSLLDNKFSYSGIQGYEVGRIKLDNYNKNLNIDLIFDGQSSNIIIPKIPTGLVPDEITNIINERKLRLVQAVAENYSTFSSYNSYISNVLKTSTPFYLKSPKRERIFKPYSSSSPKPIFEFPYLNRFI